MAQVAPTDSPTVVEAVSASVSAPASQPNADYPQSDHHHRAFPLLHDPSPVYQGNSIRDTQYDCTPPDNSQPELPPRDDPPSDHPQGQSPHTPDQHHSAELQDHPVHQELPPTTPDTDLGTHSLPVNQSQNGPPIMGMVASFGDMNLAPQISYAPPPPMQMQPVVPLGTPQHPTHIVPHHPHHHQSPHKTHHPQHLLPPYHLWVPQERVGAVIGGHGAVIRSLQDRSGATIQVHNDTVRGDVKLFTISGTLPQYEIAKELINEIVDKPRQSHLSSHGVHSSDRSSFSPGGDRAPRSGDMWKSVYVPTTCVGLVIGRNGETIRSLQDRSGAAIKVTPDEEATPDSETRSILISGTEDAISTAHQLISEIVMDARLRRPPQGGPAAGVSVNGQLVVVEVLTVPNEKVGLIIGKRGAAIRDLQHKSGARIQVTKDDSALRSDGSRPVTITGTRVQVDEARAMIGNKINMPLMPSAPVSPLFNNSQPGPANIPPATAPTHQLPYMMPNVYDPAFHNGQQPFQQMYDPNDPAASSRSVAYFQQQYMGYNNFAVAHQQRHFPSQMQLHYPHLAQQVPQEQQQQAPHQEPQEPVGQQPQFPTAPNLQQGQPVDSMQGSPNMLPRDATGNVVLYPSHYQQVAPHLGPHQMYNPGAPNARMFPRREHMQVAHAQLMMHAQAVHAQAVHAQAVHAAQVQAIAHAGAEEADGQTRQQQSHTPNISTTTEDNEQPNG